MIKVYSTPNCPRCARLKTALEEAGIEYEESHDVQSLIDRGVRMAPAVELEDGTLVTKLVKTEDINNLIYEVTQEGCAECRLK